MHIRQTLNQLSASPAQTLSWKELVQLLFVLWCERSGRLMIDGSAMYKQEILSMDMEIWFLYMKQTGCSSSKDVSGKQVFVKNQKSYPLIGVAMQVC